MDFTSFLVFIGFAAVGFALYQVTQQLKAMQEGKKEDQSFLMLQKHLMEIEKNVKAQDKSIQDSMARSQESLQKQFTSTSKIVKEVTEKLTKLDETNKQVVGFAEQMKSLENILKNPKQRGILGEFFLENLLSNVLPPSNFQMQYSFKNGEMVDAAIFVREQIIPIDAKFSLENYNRIMEEEDDTKRDLLEREFKADLKKRIDETSKYVRPEENTTDFAFMFIPADGVFYNLLLHKVGTIEVNTSDLIDYAFKKKVILVSPMTFYAYLQTVMQALRALAIESSAKEIQKNVEVLGKHINSYEDYFRKIGGHLGTTVNTYNNASKELKKIDKDVFKITGGKAGGKLEAEELDKPKEYEPSNVKVSIQQADLTQEKLLED